jgi:hypothetical protein
MTEPNIIRKVVPSEVDYTTLYCDFEIRSANGNAKAIIREKPGIDIIFEVIKCSEYAGKLFVRCMIVDPKNLERPVVCATDKCKNYNQCNILGSRNEGAVYQGTAAGIYPDERPSVLIPLQRKFSLYFKCRNDCFVNKNRDYASLIIILENESGEMFARRHFNVRIVVRPDRKTKY